MVRLMIIEIGEGRGIIETTTLTVPLTEETTPLTIKRIQVLIGIQIKDIVLIPVYSLYLSTLWP